MAAAAGKPAARIFPSLAERRVLLTGAGERAELAATHFAAQSPERITVANRTLERAHQLAHRFSARAIELRSLATELHEHDIVVSCTASSLPILGPGRGGRARGARGGGGQAEPIIEPQVGQFMHWMRSRETVPLIRTLRERADEARRHELERALKLLHKGEDPKEGPGGLPRGITN